MDVIKVTDVHKSFKVFFDKGGTLKEKILFKKRNTYEEHTVLDHINLNIKSGEVVGLVGENGSGKSTLLKLITRIIYPDQGKIEVLGKVSSLLELGAGFHPDMTGRENIYINASILGLSKKDIDERIENIIEFSELGEFIDNPIRTYSSGMYMRLAFSVAINVDAEILLIDEILAVGDAAFQSKCFEKLEEIKESGTTIVIVSHDLNSIKRLCDRAVWINHGKIELDSKPQFAIEKYLDYVMKKNNHNEIKIENNGVNIKNISLSNENGNSASEFKTDSLINVEIEFEVDNKNIEECINISLLLLRNDGMLCYKTVKKIESKLLKDKLKIIMEKTNLLSGNYNIVLYFHDALDIKKSNVAKKDFYIKASSEDSGIVNINHCWIMQNNKLEEEC